MKVDLNTSGGIFMEEIDIGEHDKPPTILQVREYQYFINRDTKFNTDIPQYFEADIYQYVDDGFPGKDAEERMLTDDENPPA